MSRITTESKPVDETGPSTVYSSIYIPLINLRVLWLWALSVLYMYVYGCRYRQKSYNKFLIDQGWKNVSLVNDIFTGEN